MSPLRPLTRLCPRTVEQSVRKPVFGFTLFARLRKCTPALSARIHSALTRIGSRSVFLGRYNSGHPLNRLLQLAILFFQCGEFLIQFPDLRGLQIELLLLIRHRGLLRLHFLQQNR